MGANLSYGCLQECQTPAQLPPNSCPTPAHLPDVGGDTPAAATHSSADLIRGIENKWGKHERAQTVVTKKESFCVRKFIKWSLVINDNVC